MQNDEGKNVLHLAGANGNYLDVAWGGVSADGSGLCHVGDLIDVEDVDGEVGGGLEGSG